MSETISQKLDNVAETLLITLYVRSVESQRPDALLRDETAVALVRRLESDSSYDFARVRQIKMDADDQTAIILRNREFDRYVREFLDRFPGAVVVHIGCGLDTRFERVDNGQVEWYDLDFPEVIALRRELISGEGERYHLLGCSAFDSAWLATVGVHRPRPFLFLAEGVLMYCEEAQVKSLVLALRAQFPGAELVFDAFSPYLVRMNNLRMRLSKVGARYHWALKRGADLERWSEGICLLDEWNYFSRPEPRLAHVQWVRHIPFLARASGIFHCRLGTNALQSIGAT
jgi:O-methyltransferase involved in polyketide biosynthesis